jgi:glycerol-3-phosphate dehydrogenase (NAD(P)+)
MKSKVTILGAGAMGSAISIPLLDSQNSVNLWGTEYDIQILNSITEGKPHPSLKAIIPKEVNIFYPEELDRALEGSDTVLIAVTSDALRSIVERALPYIKTVTKFVILTKGLYANMGKVSFPSKVVEEITMQKEEIGKKLKIVSVGGPCIAEELATRVPTAAVYASRHFDAAKECKKNFQTSYYRIHISTDTIGVELCAALKNVYSIAIGWCRGLTEASNLNSMFNLESIMITQAVKEMSIISQRLGGRPDTAFGLAGLGDLNVTVRKIGGRNFLFGSLLGKGMSVREALGYLSRKGIHTIEGVSTGLKIYDLLTKEANIRDVLDKIPLLRLIVDVINGNIQIKEAIRIILDVV